MQLGLSCAYLRHRFLPTQSAPSVQTDRRYKVATLEELKTVTWEQLHIHLFKLFHS